MTSLPRNRDLWWSVEHYDPTVTEVTKRAHSYSSVHDNVMELIAFLCRRKRRLPHHHTRVLLSLPPASQLHMVQGAARVPKTWKANWGRGSAAQLAWVATHVRLELSVAQKVPCKSSLSHAPGAKHNTGTSLASKTWIKITTSFKPVSCLERTDVSSRLPRKRYTAVQQKDLV